MGLSNGCEIYVGARPVDSEREIKRVLDEASREMFDKEDDDAPWIEIIPDTSAIGDGEYFVIRGELVVSGV